MAIFAVEARKSLVDRNPPVICAFEDCKLSRLARASWIEIVTRHDIASAIAVEARKSLVDRNLCLNKLPPESLSRGSQEPRGSK